MVSFEEAIGNDQVLHQFNVWALNSKEYLEWVLDGDIPPPCDIGGVVTRIAGLQLHGQSSIVEQLKTSMFRKCTDLVLQELGTQEVRQILHVSIVAQTYSLKTKNCVYVPAIVLMEPPPCGAPQRPCLRTERCVDFLKTADVLCGIGGDAYIEITSDLPRRSIFESFVPQRSVRSLHNVAAHSGTAIGNVDQMIVKAYTALCHVATMPPLSKLAVLYTISS